MKDMTEDIVRDLAGRTLGFYDTQDAKSSVGQITTFNQLGFKGINDKPDGWYLPNNTNFPAIVLETKSTSVPLKQTQINELIKNIKIVMTRYKNVIGILYNGYDIIVYKNLEIINTVDALQNKEYYLGLFNKDQIDKEKIYNLTAKINNCLHIEFGIKNLYHRMIFTACALVAKRYGASFIKGMNYETFHTSIHSTLAKSLEDSRQQNQKLDLLLEVYSEIRMNSTENQVAIDNFIEWISQISDCINSDFWNGEDVMGIFFNEFNRYKKKSESGQIFTPDHITSFMYRLIDVNKDDIILDATCGSGAFLVKAMCNMIKECGGLNTTKSKEIKSSQLYGIEFDREIFALACANMLIHKDGKTNLVQLDARTQQAGNWIKSKPITKVLMNPPFENKYGCMTIVENVLDNVRIGTKCAFILPDKKLEKVGTETPKRILKHHTLEKIIKLPEKLFFGAGITTSIFVFEAGIPQKDREIFSCYIEDDGLETVKNQGRHDVKGKWPNLEDYWIDVINKQTGSDTIQWLKPNESLSYQLPKKEFEIYEDDFRKSVMDYALFKQQIDTKTLEEKIINAILYGSEVDGLEFELLEQWKKDNTINEKIDVSDWKEFSLLDLFEITGTVTTPKNELNLDDGGIYPYITTAASNNGVAGYSEKYTEEENILTIDSAVVGTCLYQEYKFTASDHVEKLIPRFKLTKEIGLYLSTIINVAGKLLNYAYNEKRSQTALKKESILLPITKDGQPNWSYMENYIKGLPFSTKI